MNNNVPKINKNKLFLNKEGKLTNQIKEELYSEQIINYFLI